MALLPVNEAQVRLLALAKPLPIERVPVAEALGRFLAEPLVAARTQPPADLSAMDGYALRQTDMPGPWRVIGESSCGHPFTGTCGAGEAVRIATGALMPDGADMVLMQEDAARDGDDLALTGTPPGPLGKHIRRKGNDFAKGAQLLPAGSRLGPGQLALVLSAGHNFAAVRRPPRIAIIDSGDELSEDAGNCADHQIPASNGVMLEALVRQAVPCEVERIGPVIDRMDALAAALQQAEGADVIVTSGGASVGEHDLIRPALAEWGATLDFWKVAIKPGKPIMVATRGHQVVVGLPGNPVSSHVTAYLFLLPLLRALLGAVQPLPQPIAARAAEALPAGGPRQEFQRAHFDGIQATSRLNQDSGALGALARANALIDRPIDAPAVEAGGVISLYLLENGGIA
ncbi:molybdopterin molybdotransferase MoeA [Novosphingobium sp.]|uniref:molybdopterin molybdotransferase MoeA n=1 Tax=Novosphingobium sp. TaxID=1874826 RepID=UPI0025D68FC7|nr:molybdopterin molybdotransferase MoeA [Novosphingobium sp.]MCC6925587.1 molybdopterin molybdotransferase MoeA [Novosphingobium sp.]